MKITVDLSDADMKNIMHLTGLKKKGPAIRQFIVTELMLKKRHRLTQERLDGKWSADLPPIEDLRADRNVWRR